MKHLITSIILLFCLTFAKANNIQISNISYVPSHNTIKFDISWENSWRSNILNNYDVAFVFFKYKLGGEWIHLYTGDYTNVYQTAPAGFTISYARANGSYASGVYLYRSVVGSGNNNLLNVETGITTTNAFINVNLPNIPTTDIKAFAIEMVQIPAASFTIGDGLSTNSYTIQQIPEFPASSTTITDPLATPNAINFYPSGQDFKCMKYELSQGGYRDFLNSLSYAQQVNHIVPLPSAVAGTAALYNANRNYIKIKTPGTTPNTAAVFGCDANGNGIYDEAGDGEWVACNYVNWLDQAAYLAWAGLGPMDEMQYEKAARGVQSSVQGEYAWGNTNLFNILGGPYYSTTNINQASEIMNNAAASPVGNAYYNFSYDNAGPTRNGVFATAASNRISSGGSFYGVMELSGNLCERVVSTSVFNISGLGGSALKNNYYAKRNLSTDGFAYQKNPSDEADTYWPGMSTIGAAAGTREVRGAVNATGLIYRGGSWASNAASLRISDRSGLLVIDANTNRALMANVGIRGYASW